MKLLRYLGLSLLAGSLLACTSTVGNNTVTANGKPGGNTIDWPEMSEATMPGGVFPNLKNLHTIGSGVTKKDLYYLIGRPHFSETHGAKEWNYIMKFRQQDRSVKVCQYKVFFDDNMRAQSFFWLPQDCLNEKFDLSADALFPFNRGGVADIKPLGKAKLDKLAARLVKEGNKAKLLLIGHTDFVGSDAYNQKLSLLRATSVGRYLVSRGVSASNINVEGRGESEPVVQCPTNTSKTVLVECLAPNRRVSVEITR